MTEPVNMFIPITKVNAQRREVWGWAAIEEPDNSDEILDYETSKPHFLDWSNRAQKRSGGKSLGNVRSMHQNVAAGKLIELRPDDVSKGFYVGAKIIDDGEWKKVEQGVYTGFSVGGSYLKRWSDFRNPGKMRYTAKPTELSIVDSPCIPSATFEMLKMDGSKALRKFKPACNENMIKVVSRDRSILVKYNPNEPRDKDGMWTGGGGGGKAPEPPRGYKSAPNPYRPGTQDWRYFDAGESERKQKHLSGAGYKERPNPNRPGTREWRAFDDKEKVRRDKALQSSPQPKPAESNQAPAGQDGYAHANREDGGRSVMDVKSVEGMPERTIVKDHRAIGHQSQNGLKVFVEESVGGGYMAYDPDGKYLGEYSKDQLSDTSSNKAPAINPDRFKDIHDPADGRTLEEWEAKQSNKAPAEDKYEPTWEGAIKAMNAPNGSLGQFSDKDLATIFRSAEPKTQGEKDLKAYMGQVLLHREKNPDARVPAEGSSGENEAPPRQEKPFRGSPEQADRLKRLQTHYSNATGEITDDGNLKVTFSNTMAGGDRYSYYDGGGKPIEAPPQKTPSAERFVVPERTSWDKPKQGEFRPEDEYTEDELKENYPKQNVSPEAMQARREGKVPAKDQGYRDALKEYEAKGKKYGSEMKSDKERHDAIGDAIDESQARYTREQAKEMGYGVNDENRQKLKDVPQRFSGAKEDWIKDKNGNWQPGKHGRPFGKISKGDVMNKLDRIYAILDDIEEGLTKADIPDAPEPIADIPLKGEHGSFTVEQMPAPSVLMELEPNSEPSQEVLASHAVKSEDLTKAFEAWLPKVGKMVKSTVAEALADAMEDLKKNSAPVRKIRVVKSK